MSKILGLLYEFANKERDVYRVNQDTYEIYVQKKYFPELFKRLAEHNIVIQHLVLGTSDDKMCTCVFTKFQKK